MRLAGFVASVAILACAVLAQAQAMPESPFYSRANSFGVLTAYSNDSSHMLMGVAENRKLWNVGVSYNRRLLQNGVVNWQYSAEVFPVALESDPVIHQTLTFIPPSPFAGLTTKETLVPTLACHAGPGTYMSGSIDYNYVNTCSRRWTIGEGMSPIGFEWNFLTRRKVQPVLSAHGGYMYSTQPIPTYSAGSFNFTFDFGAGVEVYRTKRQSIRAEYRFHHISNHDTANDNPGIDNGVFQVTYSFGK
jgi:opacity protein-like surface antigen